MKNKGEKTINTFFKNDNYKNPLLDVGKFVSEHFDKNQDNQVEGTISECVLCGKGIKSNSSHYTVLSGNGASQFLISKDEWDYASSDNNKDGGFMGGWTIGTECYKKIKHIYNVKNYVRKNKENA